MNEWITELARLAGRGEAAVLVTVAGVRGSAPREAGAKMIVTRDETIGTIGGGQLEYQCTRTACDLLRHGGRALQRYPLGASFGQCCGGVVDILFESVADDVPDWICSLAGHHARREPVVLCTPLDSGERAVVASGAVVAGSLPAEVLDAVRDHAGTDDAVLRTGEWLIEKIGGPATPVAVFGAGHVGAAVVRALAPLGMDIRWIDSRREIFGAIPAGVQAIKTADPVAEVAAMPPGSVYLVMTHSHPLDQAVCARILSRADAAYCGLIGSKSKRRRFEKQFQAEGLGDAAIAALVCPIGMPGIRSKQPAAIAAAVAAQVLETLERREASRARRYTDNIRPIRS